MRIKARILEVFRPGDRIVLKVQLLEGELQAGTRLSSRSGHQLEVLGVAFSPPDAWHAGIRLASVVLSSAKSPEPGLLLEQSSDDGQEVR